MTVSRLPSRRGLAPLEMVMGLPLILLLFALIINAGFTGMWKLRLLGAAREVAWRSRDPRTSNLPNPGYQSNFWRQPNHSEDKPLTVNASAGHPLSIPDLASAPAVRSDYGSLRVDTQLLDPKRGVLEGQSDVARKLPLLPNGLKTMHSNPKHYITDNSFPFWNTRLSNNVGRRTQVLYGEGNGVASNEFGNDWAGYTGSVANTNTALMADNLLPLGGFHVEHSLWPKYNEGRYHDPEVYTWQYRGLLPHPPGFMPQISSFISSDADAIRQSHVDPHVLKIEDDDDLRVETGAIKETEKNLPHSLAGSYVSFFSDAIGLVQDHIDQVNEQIQMSQMNLQAATQAGDTNTIASLKQTISELQNELSMATTEFQRREQILNPVIQQLEAYQSGF